MADEEKREVWQRAESWQSMAIAMAIITPTIAAFTLPWIFEAANDQVMLHRVQVVGAGVAVGLAVVTFCTVVWRGLISTEQARLQRLQVERLTDQVAATREQIEATRENNLADLLQKGAELVAETEKPAHVAAGIAILKSIAVAVSETFASEAMDLLADYLQARHAGSHDGPLCRAAILALRAGSRLGRKSDRSLHFETKSESAWSAVVGVHLVQYTGGAMRENAIPLFERYKQKAVATHCAINGATIIDGFIEYCECAFADCKIDNVPFTFFDPQTYKRCDFSGANIVDIRDLKVSIADKNWFDPSNPPVSGEYKEWTKIFLPGKPKSLWGDD